MSVELLGLDVSEQVLVRGSNTASITDVLGQIVQSRTYNLADNVGEFNPFASSGLLFLNSWRNQTIQETEVNQREVFTGSIKKVGMKFDGSGYQATIQATEPIATFLRFNVEENDSVTHSGFLVDGAASAGTQTITIDTGTTDIPVGSQVTFSTFLVPRYQITAVSGSPTTSITLDRPLSEDVADNTSLRVALPNVKTIPAAISDALVAAGLGDRIGSNFATLDAQETTAGHTITMFIRIEDDIKLSDHIAKLIEMGNYALTVSPAGILDLVDDLSWDGSDILNQITGAELIDPYEIKYEDGKLVVGYDLLYKSTNSVEIASGDVSQEIVQEYAGVNRWQPLSPGSSLAIEYPYLYTNATTADYYGEKYLDYYGVPRVQITSRMKQSISDNPLQRIQAQLGAEFAITMPISFNQNFLQEPTRLVAFQYNEQNQVFDSVTFELTNYPSPNVPRDVVLPTTPTVLASYDTYEGITSLLENDFSGDLFIEVFLSDRLTLIVTSQLTCSVEPDPTQCAAVYQNSLLNNGTNYSCRYFTRASGINSAKTDFIDFTPTDTGVALYGTGQYGINYYGS